MKTGYLGPNGTYSELAHDLTFKDTQKVMYSNFYAIFKAVASGQIHAAVVPLENSVQGSVTQCLDLLFETKDIYVTVQTFVKIEHRLMVKEGAVLSDIKTVYSHEQAIKQCGMFLSEQLSGAKVIYTDSTSASAQLIKDKTQAGIVGSHFKKDGFIFLDYDIADRKNNQTRFCVIKKGHASLPSVSSKMFIAAGSKDRPGALLELLETLNKSRLNMTKIESRPLKTKLGEYVFFIEFEADISSPKVTQTLDEIKQKATIFKLLGCY